MKLAHQPGFADVIKTEEKGSDVNMAVHLLNDAWRDKYDCAVAVTNDSDLAESLKLAKQQNKMQNRHYGFTCYEIGKYFITGIWNYYL